MKFYPYKKKGGGGGILAMLFVLKVGGAIYFEVVLTLELEVLTTLKGGGGAQQV